MLTSGIVGSLARTRGSSAAAATTSSSSFDSSSSMGIGDSSGTVGVSKTLSEAMVKPVFGLVNTLDTSSLPQS